MNVIKKIGVLVLMAGILMMNVLSVSAEEPKKLYFEEKNGKMVWNPVRGSDGNWFLSFTNMVPGGDYEDLLRIENGSKKTYDLYMQAIPVQQEEKKDELLELILMQVFLDGKSLYDGKASGKEYGSGNLQNVIYIGKFSPGIESTINVKLKLDEDTGLEFCDLLTKIDWRFMVTEVLEPANPKPINPPKTGDDSNISLYIVLAMLSVSLIGSLLHRNRVISDKENKQL